MLLFASWVCRNAADILEVQAPFNTGSRTFLGFGKALWRGMEALVLGEDLPHGTGGARQFFSILFESLILVQVIQNGKWSRRATQQSGGGGRGSPTLYG